MGMSPEVYDGLCCRRVSQPRFQMLMGCAATGLVMSLMVIAGCATWGATPDATLSATTPQPEEPIEPTKDTASEEATLAAIEEFLARTSSYQIAEAPSSNHDTARELSERIKTGGFASDSSSRQGELSRRDAQDVFSREPIPDRRKDEALANARMSVPSSTAHDQPPVGESRTGQAGPALPTLLSVSVRKTASTPSTPANKAQHHASNVAIDVNDRPVTKSIDNWLDEWESQSDNGRDFQAEWRLRLTQLALGRTESAYEFAPRLSGETRSLLSILFETVEAVRDLAQNPLLTGERALSRINGLRHALAERADLVIAHLALCRRVVTFGAYEEMDATEFVSGRSVQTIVYSEIENFSSRRLGDSPAEQAPYETRLATRIDVFTVDGVSMWSKQEPEIVDRCRRRRTDFFLAQLVTLPPTLPAGDYVMKVYVEDKLSGKAAERTLPFTMLSPVSVAQRR